MNIIEINFQGQWMSFRQDGWFNATSAAVRFEKRLQDYLNDKETVKYTSALVCNLNFTHQRDVIKVTRGKSGGTWFHPKLALHFARWLDLDFSIWCDNQVDHLLRTGERWSNARHRAAASLKVMQEMLKMVREADGKKTFSYHYSNEARLVNRAFLGEFKTLNREQLSAAELEVLAQFEIKNSLLIGLKMDYDHRKKALWLHPLALTARKRLVANARTQQINPDDTTWRHPCKRVRRPVSRDHRCTGRPNDPLELAAKRMAQTGAGSKPGSDLAIGDGMTPRG